MVTSDSSAPIAWVLNLDAELELAALARRPDHASPYHPTDAVRAAMRPHVIELASRLLGPDDVLVDDASTERGARGRVGRAYCPTPRALTLLRRAGAVPERHPPLEVLSAVNHRAFASALGPTLPGGGFVTRVDVALTKLGRPPEVGSEWRVKRAFGMAGRGQRVVAHGALRAADVAFVRSSIEAWGGVQIEPNVAIVRELALHGRIDEDGSLRVGRVVAQRCDARGQWRSTERADDVAGETVSAMHDEVARVGVALHRAGYFGPFGVDAFAYRAGDSVALQPRSEINARYSMGFAIGFGGGAPRRTSA